jgi:hypothetical protein
MQTAKQLEAQLADIQSEMIVRLEEFDGVEGVCSFRRRSVPKFDGALFRRQFPNEAAQCWPEVAPAAHGSASIRLARTSPRRNSAKTVTLFGSVN